jgi:hypothetical protein
VSDRGILFRPQLGITNPILRREMRNTAHQRRSLDGLVFLPRSSLLRQQRAIGPVIDKGVFTPTKHVRTRALELNSRAGVRASSCVALGTLRQDVGELGLLLWHRHQPTRRQARACLVFENGSRLALRPPTRLETAAYGYGTLATEGCVRPCLLDRRCSMIIPPKRAALPLLISMCYNFGREHTDVR